MNEIVKRLHESHQIELAKSILENAGYSFSRINESFSEDEKENILSMFRSSNQDVLDYREKWEDGANVFVVECGNSNPTYIAELQDKLDTLDDKDIGYEREDNGNGFYGRNYIFYKYDDFDESKNMSESADNIKKRITHTKEFDNGRVLHGDWKKMSVEDSEEEAKQRSIEDPDNVYYVQYDDVMNPSSDKYWKNGQECDYKGNPINVKESNIMTESEGPISHEGWDYYAMPKDYKGPWVANQYNKDYMDLYLTIFPPQAVPGDEPSEDWHAYIENVAGEATIDEYKTGFSSFEDAESWINAWLDKHGYNIESEE